MRSPGLLLTAARIEGARDATALALLDGRLLIAAAGARERLTVDVARLAPGGAVKAERLPIIARGDVHVGGAEPFAAQAYQLGDLWAQPVDIQGLAAQAPGTVFLAERSYRVVLVGPVLQTPDGGWGSVRIDRVFVLPGADRSAASAADWRDKGAGLAGLDAVQGARRTEDLYAVDAGSATPGRFRLWKLDRFGLALGGFTVDLGSAVGSDTDVASVVRDGDRFLVLRGEGRGLLQPVRDAPRGETVRAGAGAPGPDVPGAGPWRGMARGPDGTLWLVSGGASTYVAWRRP